MINISIQLTRLLRLTKSKFLLALAITGLMAGATLSRADSDGSQSEQGLAGTWISSAEPGVPPSLFSFMSDGRLIFSRTIVTPTGPSSFELVGTGHGEWIRKGRDEFASTMFLLRSGPTADFTGLVKVTSTFKLDRKTDQITSAGTVYIYDAGGNLLFSFPSPGSGVYSRVTVGQ
jgi:hypothetical protein